MKKNSMIRYREMVLAEGFAVQEIVENCLTSIVSKCKVNNDKEAMQGLNGVL